MPLWITNTSAKVRMAIVEIEVSALNFFVPIETVVPTTLSVRSCQVGLKVFRGLTPGQDDTNIVFFKHW